MKRHFTLETPKPRWSIWKKLLIIPLFLAVALELLFVWVIIDETISPPRIINGQADDAPRNAAFILGFRVPVIYLGYAAVICLIRLYVLECEAFSKKKAGHGKEGKQSDVGRT